MCFFMPSTQSEEQIRVHPRYPLHRRAIKTSLLKVIYGQIDIF